MRHVTRAGSVRAVTTCLAGCFLGLGALARAEPTDGDETTMVIVEGVGADVEAARRDAYRMAVRQVLGSLVDSKTLVENDRLINDKVVVYSDGFVDHVEPLPDGEVREAGGLVRVRVKAFVKQGQLEESLQANAIAPAGSAVAITDARSQFARVVSEQDRKKNARESFLAMAEGYPANCFAAEVGQPKITEVSDGVAKCDVRVTISVTQKEYDEFLQRIVTFLESGKIEAEGKFDIASTGNPQWLHGGGAFCQDFLPGPAGQHLAKRFDDLGHNDSVGGETRTWAPGLLGHRGEPVACCTNHLQRTGRMPLLFCLQSVSDPRLHGRWIVVDSQVNEWPSDLLTTTVVCRIGIRNTEGFLFQHTFPAKYLGHSTTERFGDGVEPSGYTSQFPAVFIAPGFLKTRDRSTSALVYSTLEFTIQLPVPEAIFDKPDLVIEASLTNAPKEPVRP